MHYPPEPAHAECGGKGQRPWRVFGPTFFQKRWPAGGRSRADEMGGGNPPEKPELTLPERNITKVNVPQGSGFRKRITLQLQTTMRHKKRPVKTDPGNALGRDTVFEARGVTESRDLS